MPRIDVVNIKGEKVGDIELSDNIFGVEVRSDILHMSVINQLANKRQGTQSTRTVSEVRGGGRKPWRQKGTGRARQGSIRSAQWTGGGVALGPKPRSYNYSLPKKVKRLALKNALSSKVAANKIVVLDEINFDAIKTKQMVNVLENLKIGSSALLVLEDRNINVEKSARNIPELKTSFTNTINVYDILKYDSFIITRSAVEKVEEVYA